MNFPRRRADRVDESQPGIVLTLEAAGASVEVIPGRRGRPDLLVGFRGVTYLLECKTPGRERQHREHIERQARWRRDWRGGPVEVVSTPEQALRAIGALPTLQPTTIQVTHIYYPTEDEIPSEVEP